MNIDNLEYLKKRLEAREWGHLAPEMEENMTAGKQEFDLYTTDTADNKELEYELQFRKHNEHDFYYFNRINVALAMDGQVVSHASFRESWNLMPEEMSRLLEYGSKVAVYKEGMKNDAGEPFNAWISVNEEQPQTENGALNLNTYHDNYYKKYPFELDNAVSRLPKSIQEQIKDKTEAVKQDLKRGIPVPVMVDVENGKEQGYLSINAKIGRVDVLDNKMEPVELSANKEQQITKEQSEQQADGDVKKKPWQQQQRLNQNKNRQGKGMSM